MAVVFGIIVEILIFRDDFYHRKSLDLSPVQIGSAGKLTSLDRLFDHDCRSLGEGIIDGRHQSIGLFHFRDTEAGTSVSRFYEERQSETFYGLGSESIDIHSFTDECIRRKLHVINIAEIALARIFVERHRRYESAAPAVRNAEHLEITLK